MKERRIHAVFEASLLVKGGNALIECAAGGAIAVTGSDSIHALVGRLTRTGWLANPHNFLAAHLLDWASNFSIASQRFVAFYLLSHGIIKLVVVIGLMRERRWAYPVSLVALAGFIAYQLYRYSFTHATALLLLTAFDLFLIVLVWHEYRLVRHHLPTH